MNFISQSYVVLLDCKCFLRDSEWVRSTGSTKALFKVFISWLLRDKMNGFSLVAHNGAGFDNHYLFHYLTVILG